MSAGHDHHGHAHGVSAETSAGWLVLALVINLAFMVVEVVVGLIADSLALLSDAAHMLTDVGAIALALVAVRLASRAPSGGFTFGLKRSEILSAQLNGAALLLLAGFIAFEAIGRLGSTADVDAPLVIAVGLTGAVANGAAAFALARANRRSLNIEGAYLHNLADLFSSLAAAVAGAVILFTGFDEADSIAALLVAVLMVRGGVSLLIESGRVLLEAAPRGMEAAEIGQAMAASDGVVEVHDLHIWEVTSGFPAMSAHVLVAAGDDCHSRRRELQTMLGERFGLTHTTLQVDHEHRKGLVTLDIPGKAPS
ncbi:MAG: cation diffusion facilitator family transporter [Thermoleophilaceae bacterium]